ncbi:alpha-galactosidase [Sphingobacterium sp. CZ-UAM]|uniref:alpha-galactosidase n=1 Tax=Sphingobacterium sp. CZ-UAM TaxID=1933868 RepID=UPI000984E3D7|nr:alpha-galactosidase [Sphingobacterium sp. CZ-UAM]OOG18871.1 alpha-galactosidase [Sphingobacterium sp. CZ-UAM]
MRFKLIILALAWIATENGFAQNKENKTQDWLINTAAPYQSRITLAGQDIVLDNGLVRRSFRISPNAFCYDYTNLTTGQQLIRAVQPEAQLQLNGKWYNVGGVDGQKERAYLRPEWMPGFTANANDFSYVKHEIAELDPLLPWKGDKWWSTHKAAGKGKVLTFTYAAPANAALNGVEVKVHYAIYDGIPLISKWVTVQNHSKQTVQINQVINEKLALVEEESAVVGSVEDMKKQHGLYVESNFAFNNAMRYHLSDQSLHWKADSTYTSQVNYNLKTPAILEIYPTVGVGIKLAAEENFSSIRSWELLMDSYDRERRGLAIRKMYRTIAPWTTANPIFMHLVSKKDEQVYSAIDQCAATGYEALILSFGSHVNMEDTTAANLAALKKLADYAHSKNIKIGAYSLFSSRKISEADDIINPKTGKTGGTFFENAPCFGSNWGIGYAQRIKTFFEKTGFDIWENDGPFPGDQCASTSHPGHHGLEDSQWVQFNMQKQLYHWLNARGVYINSPDWYFLDGSNKTGIGYREVNFSLPRENQRILNRQNIYDALWEQNPSMGWGFVPLTAYQGGGKEAVLEPLHEHREDYKQLMMQYYGAGVQACYRGPRLYDTEQTKQTVIEVIQWYKKYRNILNADLIHLRRADGRDWDGFLHVNASEKGIKGLGMLFNPLKTAITRTIELPLYYTGLTGQAKISFDDKAVKTASLDHRANTTITLTIPAESYRWFTVE